MKKIILSVQTIAIVLIITALVGCKKSTSRTLTSATGSIYECLVVMNDAPLTQEQRDEIAKLGYVIKDAPGGVYELKKA